MSKTIENSAKIYNSVKNARSQNMIDSNYNEGYFGDKNIRLEGKFDQHVDDHLNFVTLNQEPHLQIQDIFKSKSSLDLMITIPIESSMDKRSNLKTVQTISIPNYQPLNKFGSIRHVTSIEYTENKQVDTLENFIDQKQQFFEETSELHGKNFELMENIKKKLNEVRKVSAVAIVDQKKQDLKQKRNISQHFSSLKTSNLQSESRSYPIDTDQEDFNIDTKINNDKTPKSKRKNNYLGDQYSDSYIDKPLQSLWNKGNGHTPSFSQPVTEDLVQNIENFQFLDSVKRKMHEKNRLSLNQVLTNADQHIQQVESTINNIVEQLAPTLNQGILKTINYDSESKLLSYNYDEMSRRNNYVRNKLND